MYIQSKLTNIDFSLFDFRLPATENITSRHINTQPVEWLNIDAKLQYNKDFCIIDTKFSNAKALVDSFSIQGDYVLISFASKGKSSIENDSGNANIHMGNVQISFEQDSVWEILMPANRPTHYMVVLLTKEYYLGLLKNEAWASTDFLYKKVAANNSVEIGEHRFPISFSIHQILQQINTCRFPDTYKATYIQLKLKEFFYVYHIQQNIPLPTREISEETLEKVQKAKAYLGMNFHNAPTIKQLSRKVLLNEQKLKSSFKALYKTTIRGYIIQLKMKKALNLLERNTVQETASLLGYKSTSHFINMYKKHYGHTPKQTLSE